LSTLTPPMLPLGSTQSPTLLSIPSDSQGIAVHHFMI
jgi:hypothetical protein